MKRALVFGGGGSRGAYELGVWKAIKELNIQIDIVTGTSIGALNGALFVMGKYEEAKELYEHLQASDITKDEIDLDLSLDDLMNRPGKLKDILISYKHNKGCDISPLKAHIERLLDYDTFINSPIDFGMILTQFPNLECVEVTKEGMPQALIVKQFLATASAFPAFPICEIEGKNYIDGGYNDNVPINFAYKMGANEIIAVDLNYDKPSHLMYRQIDAITWICPHRSLGTMLSFTKESIHTNMTLGYLDTMKAFGKYAGFKYTFTIIHKPFFLNDFLQLIALLEVFRTFDPEPFFEALYEHTDGQKLSAIDFDYRILELFLELLDYKDDIVYNPSTLNQELYHLFKNKEDFNYTELFKSVASIHEDSKFQLIGCFYYFFKDKPRLPYEKIQLLAKLFSKEILCAFYLYLILDRKKTSE